MTDYVKSTNFTSKDSLASGNPLKIIKGTEFDVEFNNIAVAVTTKADIISPAFTGVPTAPTAGSGTTTSQLATTAFAQAAISSAISTKADIASPTFTGTPAAPTASVNTNTTQVATTAFVVAQIADDAPTKTGTGASGTWGIAITGNAATVTTLTTLQVLNATASASVGSVGSYAFLVRNGDASSLAAGSTAAGSSLVYGAVIAANAYIYNTAVDGRSTTSPSGTWRLMGEFAGASDSTKASLWLRIS